MAPFQISSDVYPAGGVGSSVGKTVGPQSGRGYPDPVLFHTHAHTHTHLHTHTLGSTIPVVADGDASGRVEPPPAVGRRPGSAKTRNTVRLGCGCGPDKLQAGLWVWPCCMWPGHNLLSPPGCALIPLPQSIELQPLVEEVGGEEGGGEEGGGKEGGGEEGRGEEALLRTPTIVVEGEQLERTEFPAHDRPEGMEQGSTGVGPAAIPQSDSLGQPRTPQFYDRELDVSLPVLYHV